MDKEDGFIRRISNCVVVLRATTGGELAIVHLEGADDAALSSALITCAARIKETGIDPDGISSGRKPEDQDLVRAQPLYSYFEVLLDEFDKRMGVRMVGVLYASPFGKLYNAIEGANWSGEYIYILPDNSCQGAGTRTDLRKEGLFSKQNGDKSRYERLYISGQGAGTRRDLRKESLFSKQNGDRRRYMRYLNVIVNSVYQMPKPPFELPTDDDLKRLENCAARPSLLRQPIVAPEFQHG